VTPLGALAVAGIAVAGIVGVVVYETWRPECGHLHCPDRRQRWHRHPEDAMW
jgi:hypothetical protein